MAEGITRERLAQLLNEDLSREYQAIISYVVYSQVLKGAEYMSIADQLEEHTHICDPSPRRQRARPPLGSTGLEPGRPAPVAALASGDGFGSASQGVNCVRRLVGLVRTPRRTGARRGNSRYFFTVQVMVFSSQVPAALSQSALVLGASCAKAGAATASRRPVMSAKLTVFISVSYLLEHPKMPEHQRATRQWSSW